MRICALLVIGLLHITCRTYSQQDSPVDCFPLSVGNQWTYRYDAMRSENEDQNHLRDTGIVNYAVIGTIVTVDSTRWILRERRELRLCNEYWLGLIECDTARVDSMTFEIVELHQGQHQLYRAGAASDLWSSVFPFSAELVDTTKVYRYLSVDSTGSDSFTTHRQTDSVLLFTFIFKKETGVVSVSCREFLEYSTDHRLMSFVITSIGQQSEAGEPDHLDLSQNYPNPFNPSTTIRYVLPRSGHATLRLYDILGREVLTLMDGMQEAGTHQEILNMESISHETGTSLASGVYFYQISSGNSLMTRKLVYLR